MRTETSESHDPRIREVVIYGGWQNLVMVGERNRDHIEMYVGKRNIFAANAAQLQHPDESAVP